MPRKRKSLSELGAMVSKAAEMMDSEMIEEAAVYLEVMLSEEISFKKLVTPDERNLVARLFLMHGLTVRQVSGLYSTAEESFEDGLKLNPQDPDLYNQLCQELALNRLFKISSGKYNPDAKYQLLNVLLTRKLTRKQSVDIRICLNLLLKSCNNEDHFNLFHVGFANMLLGGSCTEIQISERKTFIREAIKYFNKANAVRGSELLSVDQMRDTAEKVASDTGFHIDTIKRTLSEADWAFKALDQKKYDTYLKICAEFLDEIEKTRSLLVWLRRGKTSKIIFGNMNEMLIATSRFTGTTCFKSGPEN